MIFAILSLFASTSEQELVNMSRDIQVEKLFKVENGQISVTSTSYQISSNNSSLSSSIRGVTSASASPGNISLVLGRSQSPQITNFGNSMSPNNLHLSQVDDDCKYSPAKTEPYDHEPINPTPHHAISVENSELKIIQDGFFYNQQHIFGSSIFEGVNVTKSWKYKETFEIFVDSFSGSLYRFIVGERIFFLKSNEEVNITNDIIIWILATCQANYSQGREFYVEDLANFQAPNQLYKNSNCNFFLAPGGLYFGINYYGENNVALVIEQNNNFDYLKSTKLATNLWAIRVKQNQTIHFAGRTYYKFNANVPKTLVGIKPHSEDDALNKCSEEIQSVFFVIRKHLRQNCQHVSEEEIRKLKISYCAYISRCIQHSADLKNYFYPVLTNFGILPEAISMLQKEEKLGISIFIKILESTFYEIFSKITGTEYRFTNYIIAGTNSLTEIQAQIKQMPEKEVNVICSYEIAAQILNAMEKDKEVQSSSQINLNAILNHEGFPQTTINFIIEGFDYEHKLCFINSINEVSWTKIISISFKLLDLSSNKLEFPAPKKNSSGCAIS